MKRIQGTLSKTYKCPKLYLEDIEKILEVLNEAKTDKVNIDADGYSYNNLEELIEIKSSVKDLNIQPQSPYISIEFSRDNARLYIGMDDLKSRGIFLSINELISKRERKLLWLSTIYNILILVFGFFVWFLTKFYDKEDPNYVIRSIVLVASGVMIIWLPVSIITHWRFYSIINLVRKDKISNFFVRNKDNIIISIVSTIIGIFLGILIQRFFLP